MQHPTKSIYLTPTLKKKNLISYPPLASAFNSCIRGGTATAPDCISVTRYAFRSRTGLDGFRGGFAGFVIFALALDGERGGLGLGLELGLDLGLGLV